MNPATLFTQWFDEVWNKANEAFIDEMLHEHVITHGLDPTGTAHGKKAFQDYYKNLRASFPETVFDTKVLVQDADTVTIYSNITAKSDSGTTVVFCGISTARYEGDKIAETWNCYDFLKMYQQLGHILVSAIQEK